MQRISVCGVDGKDCSGVRCSLYHCRPVTSEGKIS